MRDETLVGLIEEARATREPRRAACKAPRSFGTSSPSAACCARSGSRSVRAASPTPFAALDAVDLTRQEDVYFTLRQTLVSRHDELELFDRAFVAWFLRGPVAPLVRQKQTRRFADRVVRDTLESGSDEDEADESVDAARARRLRPRAPAREGLRRDDARGVRARAAPHGRDRAHAAAPHVASALSRSARRPCSTCAASAATSLRTGGEPIEQTWKARKTVPRKLVVLCDISGSMDAYARALLFYLHAIVGTGAGVEAFAFGTRLTRLTPDLATRDPEAALARANEIAVDWGSGTRIGASLGGVQRDLRPAGALRAARSSSSSRTAGSATIPTSSAREMAKLARAAFAVVWVNPLKGNPEYQPLAGGMRAALAVR